MVVLSECIYNQSSDSLYDDDFHDGLVHTLLLFCPAGGGLVYNVFVDRPFSFMFFAKIDELDGKPFDVKQLKEGEFDDLGLSEEDAKVHIHRMVRV